jgi:hypothetical protein
LKSCSTCLNHLILWHPISLLPLNHNCNWTAMLGILVLSILCMWPTVFMSHLILLTILRSIFFCQLTTSNCITSCFSSKLLKNVTSTAWIFLLFLFVRGPCLGVTC